MEDEKTLQERTEEELESLRVGERQLQANLYATQGAIQALEKVLGIGEDQDL